MEHRCEVCASFRPEADLKPARELVSLTFANRSVLLCRGHAGIAQNSRVSSLDELRALYAESHGQRSYIARRARASAPTTFTSRNAGRRSGDRAP